MSKKLIDTDLVVLLEITDSFSVLYPTNYIFVIFRNLLFKMQL